MKMKKFLLFFSALSFTGQLCHAQFSLQTQFRLRNKPSFDLVGAGQLDSVLKKAGILVLPITVAVIDSGTSILHPLLLPQIQTNFVEISGNDFDDDMNGLVDDVYGYDFVNKRAFMVDDDGHGTHVSGIIAALNPYAKILPIKVLNSEGKGGLQNILSAIRYAASRGSRVINLSLGVLDVLGSSKGAYEEAIQFARSKGALVVAAAGNENSNNDVYSFYPSNAYEDNLISVCATDGYGNFASFSNYGKWKVHVCAPGFEIDSLGHNHTKTPWIRFSGTSQATPFVAAAASILFGIKPSLQPYQVRNILMNTSSRYTNLKDKSQTEGILNIHSAVLDLISQF
jgi:subtilisin family serine protease